MLGLLWLIPAIPFASALALAVLRFSRKQVAWIAVGATAASTVVSVLVTMAFLSAPPAAHAYTQVLWTWIDVGGLRPEIAFYLDPLSLIMTLVVAFVSFLIHLYSTEFMIDDDGYSRFFAYMNLFVASMLTLLLANNLLLLYLGWEGVGLCSYLLIGFWYRDPANGAAGRKAFVVTRIGDTAMVIGLFLLFHDLGTLQIQELMLRASQNWHIGSPAAVAAALLLLGGAVGKSAQLPLQTWLPDAMAGPTPVSALIHAATMVTAGVYLIARTHVLYSLAPAAQFAVAVVGAATLLIAGFSALTQWDLKRVLAYSTMSQIGYMFLALGVGAWPAAIFHFMTHAFFKALLFLAAGIVIDALHDEHNIFRMGGLRTRLPIAFWTFADRRMFARRIAADHCGRVQQGLDHLGRMERPERKRRALDRRSGGSHADHSLYFPDDLPGFLRGSAKRGDQEAGQGDAHSMLRPGILIDCERICQNAVCPIPGDSPAVDRRDALSPNNRACFRGHRCPGISDGGVLGVHLLPAQASVRGRTGIECGRERPAPILVFRLGNGLAV